MKRLIDSKLIKKVKSFLTGKSYNKETNTTKIGGNLEVEKNLVVNSSKINNHPIISTQKFDITRLEYDDGTTTCNFEPIRLLDNSNKGSFIGAVNPEQINYHGIPYGVYCFKFSNPAPSSIRVHTISGMFTPETDFVKANGLWKYYYHKNDLITVFTLFHGVAILTDSEGNSKTYRALMRGSNTTFSQGDIILYDPSKENGEDFDFINPSALTDTNAVTLIF